MIKGLDKLALTLLIGLTLTACGGGNGGSSASSNYGFGGSVGDGPIANATVILKNAAGDIIAETMSDSKASYRFSVDVSATDFPLTVETFGGIDLVSGTAPDFDMVSVAQSFDDSHVNINPYSTIIVKSANAMNGGLSSHNVAQVKTALKEQFNFGLDTDLVPDPITTQITKDNVAEIVKASETMAEAIRRARNTLRWNGNKVDADAVVNALAADFTDGVLDGEGSGKALDAKISAVTTVASAQVLLEAMENQLKVNGKVATNAMDKAIETTTPNAVKRTANVKITSEMIDQTSEAITTAGAVDTSASLTEISETLSELPAKDITIAQVQAKFKKTSVLKISESLTKMAKANTYTVKKAIENNNNVQATTTVKSTVTAIVKPTVTTTVKATVTTTVIPTITTTVNPTVKPAVETKKATLEWSAPSTKTDGSALSLSDLDGYRIYYGKSKNSMQPLVDINDGASTRYTIKNMKSGTYYFAVTTYDIHGNESGLSNVRSATI